MEDNITSWQEIPVKAFISLTKNSLTGRITPMSTFPQYLYTSLKAGSLRIKFSENDQKPQCIYKVDAFI